MNKLSFEQVREMLNLQNRMNLTVNSKWLTQDYPFLRAVVVEVGEALEHLGWKWWKQQVADIEQLQIELIDIFHFMLSEALVNAKGNIDDAALTIVEHLNSTQDILTFDGKKYSIKDQDLRELLELLCGLAVARRNVFQIIEACFQKSGMTWDDVLKQYVFKNVLNIFRQKNGYKEGTYIKIWDGREDNVVLAELMSALDMKTEELASDLLVVLEQKYSIAKRSTSL